MKTNGMQTRSSRNSRPDRRPFLLLLAVTTTTSFSLTAPAVHAQALPVEIPVRPNGTYLRTGSDPATNALPIDLAALGIFPGDLLRLTALGFFDNGPIISTLGTALIVTNSTGGPLAMFYRIERVP